MQEDPIDLVHSHAIVQMPDGKILVPIEIEIRNLDMKREFARREREAATSRAGDHPYGFYDLVNSLNFFLRTLLLHTTASGWAL